MQRQITKKRYKIELYLQWRTNRKSYMIYWTAPFSMTLNDSYPRFQGHAILWRWISQKRYEIHSFDGILIGTYIRPTVSFRMTLSDLDFLSDLATYSMTRVTNHRATRPLCDCDSRAIGPTCFLRTKLRRALSIDSENWHHDSRHAKTADLSEQSKLSPMSTNALGFVSASLSRER